MSVKAAITMGLTITEVLELGVPFAQASNKDIVHNGLNKSQTLEAWTTVPVTKHAAFQQALAVGAATIDLRALAGTQGAVDGNGLKVQAVMFRNPATNANAITIAKGAANGYELLGAGWSITLQPGQQVQLFLNDAAPDIAGGAKTMDLSGTLAQVLDCEIVMG